MPDESGRARDATRSRSFRAGRFSTICAAAWWSRRHFCCCCWDGWCCRRAAATGRCATLVMLFLPAWFQLVFALVRASLRSDAPSPGRGAAGMFTGESSIVLLHADVSSAPDADVAGCDRACAGAALHHATAACWNGRRRPKRNWASSEDARRSTSTWIGCRSWPSAGSRWSSVGGADRCAAPLPVLLLWASSKLISAVAATGSPRAHRNQVSRKRCAFPATSGAAHLAVFR